MDRLTRTWLLLIALTGATALFSGFSGIAVVFGLLFLGWLKARLTLGRFLHLDAAPGWLGAFTFPLGLWLLAICLLCALTSG
ncbi:cytochrome C oxidase subunit IV family protein [Paracoccus albus]|uniref:cytochrome C oxidase subunit IV family protein n=1 Tax=Paracoccus albus TaxID=3017784 RepID=UPI0022F05F41|nr:cytochrome C oxidase subunit IV family protein [Paracoccus albus]WBU58942.1 hypothetical protein PAF20_08930 [Paracoccus albus]